MKQNQNKVYDFTAVLVAEVDKTVAPHDMSKLVGNVLYSTTPDIAAMDKARVIYEKGKVELSEDEARYYLSLLMDSRIISAPLKIALQTILK